MKINLDHHRILLIPETDADSASLEVAFTSVHRFGGLTEGNRMQYAFACGFDITFEPGGGVELAIENDYRTPLE